MTQTAIKEAEMLSKVRNFAEDLIYPNREDLISQTEFPKQLWEEFSKRGLASLSIPVEFGGWGASFQTVSQAGYLLNRYGAVPGVNLVLSSHWIISYLQMAQNAAASLKEQHLPKLAKGQEILSIAISEPGVGAHPKNLQTTATKQGDSYILNGTKSFLTNGPLASHFIVFAITGETNGKRDFSAFLVPEGTPGLTKTAGITLGFLHPCPHGGIEIQNCRIPASNLIGEEGNAFIQISMRMRAIEDALGAGSQVGSLEYLLFDCASRASKECAGELGAISASLQALKIIADHLAKAADEAQKSIDPLLKLYLGYRQQSLACVTMLEDLMEKIPSPPSSHAKLLARDIAKHHAIASKAHAIRLSKIGIAMLKGQK